MLGQLVTLSLEAVKFDLMQAWCGFIDLTFFAQVIAIDFQGAICTFTARQSVLVITFVPSCLVLITFPHYSVMDLEQCFELMSLLMLQLVAVELLDCQLVVIGQLETSTAPALVLAKALSGFETMQGCFAACG